MTFVPAWFRDWPAGAYCRMLRARVIMENARLYRLSSGGINIFRSIPFINSAGGMTLPGIIVGNLSIGLQAAVRTADCRRRALLSPGMA